jgi:hypothetical protein
MDSSQVAIAIKKESLIVGKLSHDLSLLESADKKVECEDHIKFIFDSYKWSSHFPQVCSVIVFLETLEHEDYGFIRIGEEHNDIETEGEYWEFGMDIKVEIDFD